MQTDHEYTTSAVFSAAVAVALHYFCRVAGGLWGFYLLFYLFYFFLGKWKHYGNFCGMDENSFNFVNAFIDLTLQK